MLQLAKYALLKLTKVSGIPVAKEILSLAGIALVIWVFAPNTQVEPATAAPIEVAVNIPVEISAEIASAEVDPRALRLEAYLRSKGSPLADFAIDLVAAADKYQLDWKLLAAIAGDESGFAKIYVRGTYNAWGWGGGYIYLGSWGNAIETISKALRENYLNKWGATNVDQIGRIWAADPDWSRKVKMYMNQIDAFVI